SATVACAAVGGAALLAIDAVAGPMYDAWKQARLHDAHVRSFVDNFYMWIESGTGDPSQRVSEHLAVGLNFRLDPLSAVMIFVVTLLGFLFPVYSLRYPAPAPRPPPLLPAP